MVAVLHLRVERGGGVAWCGAPIANQDCVHLREVCRLCTARRAEYRAARLAAELTSLGLLGQAALL